MASCPREDRGLRQRPLAAFARLLSTDRRRCFPRKGQALAPTHPIVALVVFAHPSIRTIPNGRTQTPIVR